MNVITSPAYEGCFSQIKQHFSTDQVKQNAPLSPYTTFRIGGNADLLIEPATSQELALLLSILGQHQVPYRIMGHGSNLLIDDLGVRGVVIRIGENFSAITLEQNLLTAQSGASLAAVAKAAAKAGLSGMVSLCGIPGSLGGAVYMNAGAYGGEISDYLVKATLLYEDGTIEHLTKEEMHFAYRHSLLQEKPVILLEAQFALLSGETSENLFAQMKELTHRRNEKQPMTFPSAGSVFKRPQGHYASALIDQCHLKGTAVGGAMVSPKHAGFIVNTGQATAKDVKDLIALVQQKVYETFAVALEPEIRIWQP